MSAEATGMSFDELVVNILRMTLEEPKGSSDVA
jgi:hypothetical protein